MPRSPGMDLGRLAHTELSPAEKRQRFWRWVSIVMPCAMGLLRLQDIVAGGVGPATLAAFCVAVMMFIAPPFAAELLIPHVKRHFDIYRAHREEAEIPNRRRQELLVLQQTAREAAGNAASTRHRIADLRQAQSKIADSATRKILSDPHVLCLLDDADDSP